MEKSLEREEPTDPRRREEKKLVSDRIKALEGMRDLVKNDGVKNVLDTVMSEKFEADTWANWAKKDGPKMIGALAVGVAAAGLTVATFGAAAPLVAIAKVVFDRVESLKPAGELLGR